MAAQELSGRDPVSALIEQQRWVSPSAETKVQDAVQAIFHGMGPGGDALLSFLHGHWLHEPLHVVMTDVPVGSWTVTAICDGLGALTERPSLNTVADGALIIGLAGAVGAAVTGIVDWSEVKKEAPRQIGAVHGLLNVATTVLYGASYFARKRKGSRSTARTLAFLGFAMVSLSAHLGGNMIYEHGVRVRRDALLPR